MKIIQLKSWNMIAAILLARRGSVIPCVQNNIKTISINLHDCNIENINETISIHHFRKISMHCLIHKSKYLLRKLICLRLRNIIYPILSDILLTLKYKIYTKSLLYHLMI